MDADGHLVVVERDSKRLQALHRDGSYVKTIGDGTIHKPFGVAALSLPQRGICYAVTNINDHCVRVFRQWTRRVQQTMGYYVVQRQIRVVVDRDNQRIQVFTTDGNFNTMFGSKGESDGQFNSPSYNAEDRHGYFLVMDQYNHRVQVFTSDTFSHVATFRSSGCLSNPQGITVSPSGTVYVNDWGKHCILCSNLCPGASCFLFYTNVSHCCET